MLALRDSLRLKALRLSPGLLLAACGSAGDTAPDTGTEGTAGGVDSGTNASLRACPGVADCFLLTPAETGLPAGGAGAEVDQVALRPALSSRSELLIFLNGSGGAPLGPVGDPNHNLYTVARDEGLHALGVSYRSGRAIGLLCPPSALARDACYEPTRLSVLTGVPQTDAAPELADITPDEGVYARVAAALRTLASGDPDGGWAAFLDDREPDAERSIRWDKVLVSGHSQGGGHAALVGKLHAVARVVMLASPCDSVAGAPATWLTRSADYQTAASRFVGLGEASDSVCPAQFAAWDALDMSASAGDNSATLCADEDAHSAPVRCVENEPRWRAMLR